MVIVEGVTQFVTKVTVAMAWKAVPCTRRLIGFNSTIVLLDQVPPPPSLSLAQPGLPLPFLKVRDNGAERHLSRPRLITQHLLHGAASRARSRNERGSGEQLHAAPLFERRAGESAASTNRAVVAPISRRV